MMVNETKVLASGRKKGKPDSSVAQEAMARMHLADEADGGNRSEMLEALKFSYGDQWADEIKMQRQLENRPCLTINKTQAFVKNVINSMRQQRPRIKVHPVSDGADELSARLYQGLIRHIEVKSNAELAYDTGANYQVRAGLGFIRVHADYVNEKSFDQDLMIQPITNPFCVFMDPSSVSPDGLDCQWVIIIDRIRREDFRAKYPNASEQDFTYSERASMREAWSHKEEIMIAEYWRIEHHPDILLKLSDGNTVWSSEAKDGEETPPKKVGDFVGDAVVIDARDSCRRQVKWSKVTKSQELESRDWPGRYIPCVKVSGIDVLKHGRVHRRGMVHDLIDPQRMYNYWRTQETEIVAMAPKSPWLVAEGQTENHEDEWASANIKNYSTLTWKPTYGENGELLPPPVRLPVQQMPAASVNAAISASEDIKAVSGMFDPSFGAGSQETSGEMIAKRVEQSNLSNFDFYDNLTRSIRAVGVILLDLIPHYYSSHRAIRIIGADGDPELVTLNEQKVDEILNDMTVGEYDVVMETGPGYETKRQEAADRMLELVRAFPQLPQIAGDLLVKQLDWPGAETLSERLAMANPLAQMQQQLPKDIDPKARQALAQLMGQLQTAQQQIQQLTMEKQAKAFGIQEREKAITDREVMKELAETQRLHYREGQDNIRSFADNRTEILNTKIKEVAETERNRYNQAHEYGK